MNDPREPDPLQGLLGDLLKVIGSGPGGGTPWLDAARALAHGVATDGAPEGNADPLARIGIEELARVAELHVADATGLALASGDHPAPVLEPVSRGTWALRALDAWRPLVRRLVEAPAGPGATSTPAPGFPDSAAGFGDMLGRFAATMGPVLIGMQLGSAAGHLARRATGQYAVPLPWPPSPDLLIVPENVTAFAEDWSLPADETLLWACVRELTTHAVMSLPHVSARLNELLDEAMGHAASMQQGIGERLGLTAGDPEALQGLLSDPGSLLSDLLTPGQHLTSARLTALTTAIGGYVDHVTARVARSLTGSAAALTEAWYRYRVHDDSGTQAAGAIFGMDLGRDEVERGAAFIRGVVERAGDEGLDGLWSSARNLPTPAEVDAPGLWLARISLPDDPGARGDPGVGGGPDAGGGPAGARGSGPDDGGPPAAG